VDFQLTITIIFAAFAVAEVLQVFMLRAAVIQIRDKVDNLLPEGITPGQIIAGAFNDYLKAVGENKNHEAEILYGFIQQSATVAWDGVKAKIPMLGGGGDIVSGDLMEKIAKKNPLAALAIQLLSTAAPAIQQKITESQAAAAAKPQARGGRNIGYG